MLEQISQGCVILNRYWNSDIDARNDRDVAASWSAEKSEVVNLLDICFIFFSV